MRRSEGGRRDSEWSFSSLTKRRKSFSQDSNLDSNPDSNPDSIPYPDPKLTPSRIRNRIRNFCFGSATLQDRVGMFCIYRCKTLNCCKKFNCWLKYFKRLAMVPITKAYPYTPVSSHAKLMRPVSLILYLPSNGLISAFHEFFSPQPYSTIMS